MKTHLLFVVGPTACGKSEFAVEAAELLQGPLGFLPEIINADSIQFFAGVEIGSAKPEASLLARVPHHLLSTVLLQDDYTAGQFRRDALETIARREQNGVHLFLPVGGSGFYIQALEKGMFEVPEIDLKIKEDLLVEIESTGPQALHLELAKRDPESASKIKTTDSYRILRSLEILRSMPQAGTLTDIRKRFEAKQKVSKDSPPFSTQFIGIYKPRDILRIRVQARTKEMLKNGLIEEVKELRAQGFSSRPALQSVGYKEVQAYLDGRLKGSELEPLIVTSTMQLAKRQMTWFKRDQRITWFDSEKGFASALRQARFVVDSFSS